MQSPLRYSNFQTLNPLLCFYGTLNPDTMSAKPTIPENYQTIKPYLILKDAAKFIDFAVGVFDATLMVSEKRQDASIMHAEVRIGESTIMLADSSSSFGVCTAGLFVYVENADDTYSKAIHSGAIVIMEPADQPYGRSCGILDPFGNTWWITTHTEK